MAIVKYIKKVDLFEGKAGQNMNPVAELIFEIEEIESTGDIWKTESKINFISENGVKSQCEYKTPIEALERVRHNGFKMYADEGQEVRDFIRKFIEQYIMQGLVY
jgi:hypothetical protein